MNGHDRAQLAAAPADTNLDQVRSHMLAIPGVEEVHDLHARHEADVHP